jgi:hypothetical protein
MSAHALATANLRLRPPALTALPDAAAASAMAHDALKCARKEPSVAVFSPPPREWTACAPARVGYVRTGARREWVARAPTRTRTGRGAQRRLNGWLNARRARLSGSRILVRLCPFRAAASRRARRAMRIRTRANATHPQIPRSRAAVAAAAVIRRTCPSPGPSSHRT